MKDEVKKGSDDLDPNHWTGRLFNKSLDKFAGDIRRLKPLKSRQAMTDHNGVMARRTAKAIDDAIATLLSHRLAARVTTRGETE